MGKRAISIYAVSTLALGVVKFITTQLTRPLGFTFLWQLMIAARASALGLAPKNRGAGFIFCHFSF
jgi:hypothetical protein